MYPVLKQNFLDIDPIIEKWCADNSLFLYRESKEVEVRSVEIVDMDGNRRFQIWIDPLTENGSTVVHVWGIKRRIKERRTNLPINLAATKANLREALDHALDLTK